MINELRINVVYSSEAPKIESKKLVTSSKSSQKLTGVNKSKGKA